jgi:hypothetical protein
MVSRSGWNKTFVHCGYIQFFFVRYDLGREMSSIVPTITGSFQDRKDYEQPVENFLTVRI